MRKEPASAGSFFRELITARSRRTIAARLYGVCAIPPTVKCLPCTRPRQLFVFRHARRRDDTRDAAGFFHSRPFVDSVSQKFYTASVSLHCKDTECAEGRTRVSALAPTSHQSGQRNAGDTALSKSYSGVKGVSHGVAWADARPLRGRAPSAETTCASSLPDDRIGNESDADQNDGGHAARIEPRRRGLGDEISKGSTVARLTGRATGSHAPAALPKSIRLFDKVT
jgi:hypothetical protein